MGGGMMQLLAKGAQDYLLTGNPQISHFKIVFRRHTNFSMETIRQISKGSQISQNSNNIINTILKRDGDLITNVYFNFELPDIYSGSDADSVPYEFKWIENIGTNIFSQIRLIIGNTEVDKRTSNFFDLYSQLKHNDTEKQIYNKLIGNTKDIYDPSLGEMQMIPVFETNSNYSMTTPANNSNLYNVYKVPLNTNFTGTFSSTTSFTLHNDENDANISDFFTGYCIEIGHKINDFIEAVNHNNNTIVLNTNNNILSGTINYYNNFELLINDKLYKITDYVASTKTCTLNPAFIENEIIVGSRFKLLPIKRKILTYNSTTNVVTFETTNQDLTNIYSYNIYRSNGENMKVSLKKTGNNISSINIEDKGINYVDGEELYIDLDGDGDLYNNDDPKFYLRFSDYPHTRIVNTESRQLHKEIVDNVNSSVTKNTDFSNSLANLIPSIPKKKIKVPLNFFFSKDSGLSMPLISLQYNEVSLEITLRTIADLFTINKKVRTDIANNKAINSFNRTKTTDDIINDFISQDVFSIRYYVDATYVFLDTDERRRFAESNHDYLIEEVQIKEIKNITDSRTHDVLLYHPVKELIIIGQRTDMLANNQWNNYTNWSNEYIAPYSYQYNKYTNNNLVNETNSQLFYNSNLTNACNDLTKNFDYKFFRKNIIDSMELLFNGQVRERIKDNKYFNEVHPYNYYKTNPKDGVHAYSFSANPNDAQPAGSCNFSRISNFQINIDLGLSPDIHEIPKENLNNMYEYNFTIFAINYNILKIASGMAAKQFVN